MHKNLLSTIIAGLLFALTTQAQHELKLGINAGLNYPDVRGNNNAKYQNFKMGYLVGISLDYYLTENLSIKTNVNYEQKLEKFRTIFFNNQVEVIDEEYYTQTYKYINLPLLLKYELFNSAFFINGGPFLNYLIAQPDDSEYRTEKKNLDFGFSAGIGTNISINEKNNLCIEIRNDLGLIDTGGLPKFVDGTLKTNTIKLIIGWNLRI